MNNFTPTPISNNQNVNFNANSSLITPINFGQTFDLEAAKAERRRQRALIMASRNTTNNPTTFSPNSITTTVLTPRYYSDSDSE
jgi:hypothetical protein